MTDTEEVSPDRTCLGPIEQARFELDYALNMEGINPNLYVKINRAISLLEEIMGYIDS